MPPLLAIVARAYVGVDACMRGLLCVQNCACVVCCVCMCGLLCAHVLERICFKPLLCLFVFLAYVYVDVLFLMLSCVVVCASMLWGVSLPVYAVIAALERE